MGHRAVDDREGAARLLEDVAVGEHARYPAAAAVARPRVLLELAAVELLYRGADGVLGAAAVGLEAPAEVRVTRVRVVLAHQARRRLVDVRVRVPANARRLGRRLSHRHQRGAAARARVCAAAWEQGGAGQISAASRQPPHSGERCGAHVLRSLRGQGARRRAGWAHQWALRRRPSTRRRAERALRGAKRTDQMRRSGAARARGATGRGARAPSSISGAANELQARPRAASVGEFRCNVGETAKASP